MLGISAGLLLILTSLYSLGIIDLNDLGLRSSRLDVKIIGAIAVVLLSYPTWALDNFFQLPPCRSSRKPQRFPRIRAANAFSYLAFLPALLTAFAHTYFTEGHTGKTQPLITISGLAIAAQTLYGARFISEASNLSWLQGLNIRAISTTALFLLGFCVFHGWLFYLA